MASFAPDATTSWVEHDLGLGEAGRAGRAGRPGGPAGRAGRAGRPGGQAGRAGRAGRPGGQAGRAGRVGRLALPHSWGSSTAAAHPSATRRQRGGQAA
ncbi:PPE family protein, SVP subgroup [Micromonospora sp. NBC_00617]|uniref:PPE family protein, SVP subgroup n=1 Tax=Micromonospora sp. NBC_00617 TaxID=2903587 RepID=UPI00386FE8A8